MGGALTALAPDFERAALGVPGMNYSTLLQRSVDFDAYAPLLYPDYPNEIERQLCWPNPAALGPRRGERLRAPHDHEAAAEHAGARGADARGVRRPPGGGLHAGDHGPHLRRGHPPARPRARPLAVLEPVVRPEAAQLPVDRVGPRLLGRRPRRRAADERAEPRRQDPHGASARRGGRAPQKSSS